MVRCTAMSYMGTPFRDIVKRGGQNEALNVCKASITELASKRALQNPKHINELSSDLSKYSLHILGNTNLPRRFQEEL